jgi:ornithine lipid hydroxylase
MNIFLQTDPRVGMVCLRQGQGSRGVIMKALLAVLGYPGLLLGGVVLAKVGIDRGLSPAGVTIAVVYSVAVLVLALQRAIPLIAEWRGWWRDLGTDLLHASVSTTLGSVAAEVLARGAVIALFTQVPESGPWPHELPWWIELGLAVALCDLIAYGLHRLAHTWEPLWRIHAMHHSSERLHAFSSARTHPIYVALTHGLQALPLVALGAGPEVIALHGAFTGINGLLQHCNADLKLGFLNRILSTCDLHRWHHSADIRESQSNFGNNLALWDHVFGTYFLPEDRRVPAAVGLGEPYPRSWTAQLVAPFRRSR